MFFPSVHITSVASVAPTLTVWHLWKNGRDIYLKYGILTWFPRTWYKCFKVWWFNIKKFFYPRMLYICRRHDICDCSHSCLLWEDAFSFINSILISILTFCFGRQRTQPFMIKVSYTQSWERLCESQSTKTLHRYDRNLCSQKMKN